MHQDLSDKTAFGQAEALRLQEAILVGLSPPLLVEQASFVLLMQPVSAPVHT